MEKFVKVTGVAAALPLVNIDTDMIIPKQFLKTIKRTGLGQHLFNDMRYDANGNEIPDFVLNKPAFRQTKILIAGANFGCGSSREHAPWALADFGIRCVIAPSFADIFFNNCFKNGLLPLILPQDQVNKLIAFAESKDETSLSIDLEHMRITDIYETEIDMPFMVEAFRRHCLLNGLDDIGLTEQHLKEIDAFESARQKTQPWA